jgi:hypothetical protein
MRVFEVRCFSVTHVQDRNQRRRLAPEAIALIIHPCRILSVMGIFQQQETRSRPFEDEYGTKVTKRR